MSWFNHDTGVLQSCAGGFQKHPNQFQGPESFLWSAFWSGPGYLKYLPRFGKAQQYLLQVQGFLSQENIVVPGAGPVCGVKSPMNWKLRTSLTSSPSAPRSRQISVYFYTLVKIYPNKNSIKTRHFTEHITLPTERTRGQTHDRWQLLCLTHWWMVLKYCADKGCRRADIEENR